MENFLTIRDSDLGLDTPAPAQRRERQASRIVIFDGDKNIALLHVAKNGYHKLPGGGVKEGEDIMTALQREAREEIGCEISNPQGLGTVEEYRDCFGLHQISYCFIGDLIGEKGTPNFEQGEIDKGFAPVWMSLDKAIETLASEAGVEDYEGKFIQRRDLRFLKETKKKIGPSEYSPT